MELSSIGSSRDQLLRSGPPRPPSTGSYGTPQPSSAARSPAQPRSPGTGLSVHTCTPLATPKDYSFKPAREQVGLAEPSSAGGSRITLGTESWSPSGPISRQKSAQLRSIWQPPNVQMRVSGEAAPSEDRYPYSSSTRVGSPLLRALLKTETTCRLTSSSKSRLAAVRLLP